MMKKWYSRKHTNIIILIYLNQFDITKSCYLFMIFDIKFLSEVCLSLFSTHCAINSQMYIFQTYTKEIN